jgi:hypothetical protein
MINPNSSKMGNLAAISGMTKSGSKQKYNMAGTYYSNPKTLKQGLNQIFKGKLSSNTSRLTS